MAHCIGRIFGGTALALVLASGAYAQDAASGAVGAEADISAEPATTNPAKAAGPRLDEIVVTAQKRAQGLQDVPLSLSVVSADDIRQAGIQNFNEMARFMPNVSVNEGSNSMYIRGIGTPELNPIGEQAVAYIIDGVYVSKLAFVQAGFMDVERIEVLKGPQGTLFGRNATAGVINITNGTPLLDGYHGSASGTYGERDMIGGEASFTGPITENIGFRLAVKKSFEEGATISLTDGGTLGDRDYLLMRGTLMGEFADDVRIKLGATYFDYTIHQFMWDELHNYPDDLRTAFAPLDPNFETNLDRRTTLAKAKDTDKENKNASEGLLVPLSIEFGLWDHTITSVTGYSEVDTYVGGDIDLQKAQIAELTFVTEDSSISEELRISSAPGTIEYVVGFYYLDNDSHTEATVPVYGDLNLLSSFPVGAELGNVLSQIVGTNAQVVDTLLGHYDIQTESIAVFGEVTWNINEDLSLTVGARQTWDEKVGNIAADNSGPVPVWPLVTDAPYSVSETILDINFSPKATVSWSFTEGVNVYATYANGFRAGGFNAGATEIVNVSFDAEKSTTYEVGLKSFIWDNRLRFNTSAYYTDYEDYQYNVFVGLGYVSDNAPAMELKGIEADVTFAAAQNLVLKGTLGYNDARFTDHKNAPCVTESISTQLQNGDLQNPVVPKRGCDLSGSTVPRAPKFTASFLFDYGFAGFTGNWPFELFLGGDVTYKGMEYFDGDLDPIDTQGGYTLYNGRVGLRDRDGIWSVEVHGKNLGDKTFKLHSGDAVAQPGAHAAALNSPRYFYTTARFMF